MQAPDNTQSYNRYAYVWNNPLKYTDPSGELLLEIGIAVGIAVAAYLVTNYVTDQNITLGGVLKTAVIATITAVATFGIGTAATSLFTNFYSQAAFQAVAHGVVQGGFSSATGGTFWSGFAAGALSSIAASAWTGGTNVDADGKSIAGTGWGGAGKYANSGPGMIAFGTVVGGASAELTGGNFWIGAASGFMVSYLNHAMHEMHDKATLDGAIRKGGYGKILDDDPYLNWSNEEIGEFASKVFPDLYESADCPIFEKQLIIKNDSSIAGQALSKRSGDPGKYTIRSLGKILIRSNVLNSIRQLGSVVGHELNHMTDYVNGSYAGWINQYGREIGRAYSEVKAYGWEQSMASPYFNSQMYNHYLNLTK